ncbi:MAG: polysaccharide deacetylase family protein, partial [Candidatus Nanoarchaeia archaeon]
TIIVFCLLVVLILFFLYSLWGPSSQIFWKTMYKTNDGSFLLTFDDGPGPETPQILKTLKENNETAIFFVVCEHIQEEDIAVLKQMASDGNEIGLHGKTHVINENYDSLRECKERLESITGKEIKYYRPPYGFKAPRTMKAAKELNLTVVLWSNFPRDYNAKSSEIIVKRVTRNLNEGDIICLHDGPENRKNTADALGEIIKEIKQKNY